MKLFGLLGTVILFSLNTYSQVGIGTNTPHSTLDVRGSIAGGYRTFSSNLIASGADNTLIFTGTSATVLTLPDAATCMGRGYWIKNMSSNSSVLTINTTSAQTIEGLASWSLSQTNKSLYIVSNGANWIINSESLPSNSAAVSWVSGGNNFATLQNIGTISNLDLPFITNSTEKLRLTAAGRLGLGSATFNATNPEKFLVDAGTTTSVNAIVAKGTINNYLQLNIQNLSNGANASSDIVATANNGSETTNYVDMGINSSTNSSSIMGGANDAYLYNVGQNLLIGTGTASKSLVFMTGGTTQSSNERMRIDGNGNVGVGTTNPGNKLEVNSGVAGASGLRIKQFPAGAILFMNSSTDVAQNNNNLYFDAANYRISVAAGSSPHSTIQSGGSLAMPIAVKTSHYTLSVNDYTIICDNIGHMTITLPPAAGCAGRVYNIKKISGLFSDVIVDPSGSETIDGLFTRSIITQNDVWTVQSDGSAWYIIAK